MKGCARVGFLGSPFLGFRGKRPMGRFLKGYQP
jgi:hypothetical protein